MTAFLRKNNWFYLFLILFILVETVAAFFAFKQEPWGDEHHFYETAKYFGEGLTLDTLTRYNEMSTPLPFVLYGLWGKVFGFSLNAMRLFSLLVSFTTAVGFYLLANRFISKPFHIFLAATTFAFHPYNIGFSVFVFTDMLPITASIFGLLAIIYKRPVLWMLLAAAGLLSRQYFVFFSLPVGLFFCLRFIKKPSSSSFFMALATLLSTIPTIALFYLWEGFSPKNNINHLYMNEAFSYHIEYLTLYVAQFSLYLIPALVIKLKTYYCDRRIVSTSLFLSTLYFFYPVYPCPASLEAHFTSVGLFNTMLQYLHIGETGTHIVFYVFYLLGWPVVLSILMNCIKDLKQQNYSYAFLLGLAMVAFLIIMPFSYLLWEKYFMPIVPIALLYILNDKQSLQGPDKRSHPFEAGMI